MFIRVILTVFMIQVSSLFPSCFQQSWYDETFTKVLGKGAFGVVYKQGDLAIKYQLKSKTHQKLFENEINNLKSLNFYDSTLIYYHLNPQQKQIHHFCETNSHYVIQFNFYNEGEMTDKMFPKSKPVKPFKYDKFIDLWKFDIIYKLVSSLQTVHSHEIAHLDIKEQNILFKNQFIPVLADFGLSLQIQQGKKIYEFRGTPHFMAPEMLFNQSQKPIDLFQCDIFSLGIVFFKFLTSVDIERKSFSQDYNYDIFELKSYDPEIYKIFVETIQKMLNPDPSKRIGILMLKEYLEQNVLQKVLERFVLTQQDPSSYLNEYFQLELDALEQLDQTYKNQYYETIKTITQMNHQVYENALDDLNDDFAIENYFKNKKILI